MAKVLIGNIMGPPGATGPTGPQGEKGEKGEKGDAGMAEKDLLLILESLGLASFASSDGTVLFTDNDNKIYVL